MLSVTLQTVYVGVERRVKPRIYAPFPILVEGVNVHGESFQTTAIIDNFSRNSMYFRLFEPLAEKAELSIVVSLSILLPFNKADSQDARHHVRVKGLVERIEPKAGMVYGIVVTYQDWQYL